MRKLLIDEEPMTLLPSLAVAIGLNEAVVVQQIHYWLHPKRNSGVVDEDGVRWVYNTYAEWQHQFPFWSARTIQRIILTLETKGVIRSTDRFNTDSRDRTKWYTINYDHELLRTDSDGGHANLAPSNSTTSWHAGHANLAPSTIRQRLHTETTAETTDSSTSQKPSRKISDPESDERFETIWKLYPNHANKATARKAWSKLAPSEELTTEIFRSIERHMTTKQWQDTTYVPHLSTFLNQRRWEDEVSPEVANAAHRGASRNPGLDLLYRMRDELRGDAHEQD